MKKRQRGEDGDQNSQGLNLVVVPGNIFPISNETDRTQLRKGNRTGKEEVSWEKMGEGRGGRERRGEGEVRRKRLEEGW